LHGPALQRRTPLGQQLTLTTVSPHYFTSRFVELQPTIVSAPIPRARCSDSGSALTRTYSRVWQIAVKRAGLPSRNFLRSGENVRWC
jgi:hypothetical protein